MQKSKTQGTSGRVLEAGGYERQVRGLRRGEITMVTGIRGLKGLRLGQRGRLERQLTEESDLTLDDSTDSSPQGSALPATPRDWALQNRDVASSPVQRGKQLIGTETE